MGLNMPNGVAYRDGALYVAEVSRILRFDNIADRLYNPPKPVIVSKAFPSERHHGWKYIAFGPDGLLYVPVGAPCNVCDKQGRAVRLDHADETRRERPGDLRLGREEHGGLRLAPGDERAVVHGQRAGLDGR